MISGGCVELELRTVFISQKKCASADAHVIGIARLPNHKGRFSGFPFEGLQPFQEPRYAVVFEPDDFRFCSAGVLPNRREHLVSGCFKTHGACHKPPFIKPIFIQINPGRRNGFMRFK